MCSSLKLHEKESNIASTFQVGMRSFPKKVNIPNSIVTKSIITSDKIATITNYILELIEDTVIITPY